MKKLTTLTIIVLLLSVIAVTSTEHGEEVISNAELSELAQDYLDAGDYDNAEATYARIYAGNLDSESYQVILSSVKGERINAHMADAENNREQENYQQALQDIENAERIHTEFTPTNTLILSQIQWERADTLVADGQYLLAAQVYEAAAENAQLQSTQTYLQQQAIENYYLAEDTTPDAAAPTTTDTSFVGPRPSPEQQATLEQQAIERETQERAEGKTFEDANQALNDVRTDLRNARTALTEAEKELEAAEETTGTDEEIRRLEDAKTNLGEASAEVGRLEREEEISEGVLFAVSGVIQDFVGYYQQFSGLAGWTSLIWDDSDTLQEWRDRVNGAFCKALGWGPFSKECFVAEYCGDYADITPPRDGVLFSTPILGSPRAVAHIEAQRSLPLQVGQETSWVYTVTFGLTNPTEETMSYNVQFRGPRYTANWWSTSQILPEGGTASLNGASALIKHSAKNYGEVCLIFDPKIKSFDGKRIGIQCNDIIQASGAPTAPYAQDEVEDAEEDTTTGSDPGAPGAAV